MPLNNSDGLFATNGEPFPYNDVRLPNDVTPLHYAIYMVPDLESKTFSGKVTIQIKVKVVITTKTTRFHNHFSLLFNCFKLRYFQ